MLYEIFNEDLETIILNELYTNNISTKLVGDNLYIISLKFKNFGNVAPLVVAILTDIFYRMFDSKTEIKIDGILKE